MNKEQKSEIKILEKKLMQTLSTVMTIYNCKKISNCIYMGIGNFFCHAVFFIRVVDGTIKIVVRDYIKTYEEDNLFWTIFDMSDNIIQKESLRANGAFTVPSIQLAERKYDIEINSDLYTICKKAIEEFQLVTGEFIETLNSNNVEYEHYIVDKENFLDAKLKKMLAYILLNEPDKALLLVEEEIKKGKRGGYQNNGKDIYQYIIDYCII